LLRSPSLQTARGFIAIMAGAGVVLLAQNLAARQVNELALRLPGVDKPLHFVAFLGIALALWRAARPIGAVWRERAAIVAVATLLLAGMDELVQGFVSLRNFDLLDLAADGCGLAAAIALVMPRSRRPHAGLLLLAATAAAGAVTWYSHGQLVHVSRALLAERRGDFRAARDHYRAALASGVETAVVYNGLSWSEVESGDGRPEDAVRFGARALALRPRAPDVLDTYGWALHFAGRSAEGLPYVERARAANPRLYYIHYHLGEMYAALGRLDEACRSYERQREVAPRARESALAARSASLRCGAARPAPATP
jgi:tetratricopeptide (TPR) repeat protein